MKIILMKMTGGSFTPIDDETAIRTDKLKTGQNYTCEIKEIQDPVLHRRLMAMISFGYKYWVGGYEHIKSTSEQKESYRKDLTIVAGYYNELFSLDGKSITIQAKSLKWSKMKPETRREFYKAINRVLWQKQFSGCQDQSILMKLKEFDFAE